MKIALERYDQDKLKSNQEVALLYKNRVKGMVEEIEDWDNKNTEEKWETLK